MVRAFVRRFASGTLALAAIILVLTALPGTGSHASAQEPVSVFFGFVDGPAGTPPERVRALVGETVCGTANVLPLGASPVGFYLVSVASGGEKAGCGQPGSTVRFLLLSGQVDPGTPAEQTGTWRAGENQRLDLVASTATLGRFLGELPSGRGLGLVRWVGAAGTPVRDALATLGRPVRQAYLWDVDLQRYRVFIPNAPAAAQTFTIVDTDDLVFVAVD